MDLKEKVEKFINEQNLFNKNEKIILGVSGGVDSVVLLDILSKLKGLNLNIIIAHLNHQLRKEADKDEDFVKKLAKGCRYKFISKKIKLSKSNIEEAGREARYAFFTEVLKEEKANAVVVAHTADDNVETIILNLIRGAGVKGLSGMNFVEKFGGTTSNNSLLVKRPFLGTLKKEILTYAMKNNLKWKEDITNIDPKFSRNRIRANVIPELEKINPKTTENTLKSAENLSEAEVFISEYVQNIYKKSVSVKDKKNIVSLKIIKNESNFIKKRLFQKVLENFASKNISKKHLDDLLELLNTFGTKEISLPLGLKATKIYDNLEIGLEAEKLPKIDKKILKNKIIWNNWEITSKEEKKIGVNKKNLVFLDKGLIKELYVRQKEDGDFIYLKGNKQKKKLSDIFVDEKIPKNLRKNYPIIVNEENEVVFISGLRANDKFKASKDTKKILIVQTKNEKQ